MKRLFSRNLELLLLLCSAGLLLLMVFGLGTVLLFAERMGGAQTSFVANASSVPGSALERESEEARREHTEVFPLLMFSVGGMMLFVSANDLLVLFIALEILSLPLYILTGLARRRRLLSQEASLKYFLLGAFSSAFFLFGAALLYGYAGSVQLEAIAEAEPAHQRDLSAISGVGPRKLSLYADQVLAVVVDAFQAQLVHAHPAFRRSLAPGDAVVGSASRGSRCRPSRRTRPGPHLRRV